MKNRKGFTLIELMIVIAIIGILAAMAVPNFKKARASARQKACLSNCRVAMGGIEMYNMDNTHDYTDSAVPTTPSGVLSGYYKPYTNPDSNCTLQYNVNNTEVYCTQHGSPSHPTKID